MSDQAPASDPSLLTLHRERVKPEWIDYNGHMNVGFYVLTFDHATDTLLEHLGIGATYRKAQHASTFVVEAHVTYQNEVPEGQEISFAAQLLGFDGKRLHLFFYMLKPDGTVAATSELMLLHVDMNTRRTAPLPEAAMGRLAEFEKSQAHLPRPKEAGRVMAIRK